jgi:hypothetical protein
MEISSSGHPVTTLAPNVVPTSAMATTTSDSERRGPAESDRTGRLISALDHAHVRHGRDTWWIRVLGVHDDGADVWIQIARNGDPADDLTLRVAPGATPQDAIDTLSGLRTAGAYQRVLHVTPRPASDPETLVPSSVVSLHTRSSL